MTVAEFLEVTSLFAPNSYYYSHPTDLPLASVWNTTAWITDPSLLSTVSVKVGCRKQVIVGTYRTYHGLLAANSAEISESRGEETALAATAVAGRDEQVPFGGRSGSYSFTPQFQALTYPCNNIFLTISYLFLFQQNAHNMLNTLTCHPCMFRFLLYHLQRDQLQFAECIYFFVQVTQCSPWSWYNKHPNM
jgi:hypothetical protein